MNTPPADTSRLLLSEHPLVLLPKLAVAIGLNEAVFLQQLHYWLQRAQERGDVGVIHDERWWIYNTIPAWCQQFPFLSSRTVQRVVSKLTQRGLVITDRLARFPDVAQRTGHDPRDRISFYTIDYQRLASVAGKPKTTPRDVVGTAARQVDVMHVAAEDVCSTPRRHDVYRTETTSETTQQHATARAASPTEATHAAALRKVRHQRPSGIVWYTPDDSPAEVERLEGSYGSAEIAAAIADVSQGKEPVPGVVERLILRRRRQAKADEDRERAAAEQHRRALEPCEDRKTATRKALAVMAEYRNGDAS